MAFRLSVRVLVVVKALPVSLVQASRVFRTLAEATVIWLMNLGSRKQGPTLITFLHGGLNHPSEVDSFLQ